MSRSALAVRRCSILRLIRSCAVREERIYPGAVGCSGLLIDATRKGPFPPVGLPKKTYMEQALKIWQEAEMPKLNLKTPWYGYPLGLWDDEDDRLAEKVVQGDYFQHKEVKGR